jgi:stage V sporulation protein AC
LRFSKQGGVGTMDVRNLPGPQDQEEKQQLQETEYQDLVSQVKPKPPVLRNTLRAFLVGGIICCVGQVILDIYKWQGLNETTASAATSATMVFLGALLTGLGIYDVIGKYGGAGSIVPITGFANSIVAPAMEYKREGYIFGVGSRMFNIAGPVLVYGFLVSAVIGLVYYLFR